jgi:exopolysaccharide biosynthesis WecB/TagA/CpsF family protein
LAAIIFYPKWIKSALPEKISGSDLVWDLSKMAADNNLTIYLLGGFGETARLTSEKLSATINRGRDLNKYLRIASWSNKNPDDKSVVDEINKTGTDLLFVAYGPLKQERWIAENLPKLNVKFAVGLGGTFDYIAGKRQKPPKFVRKAGLEWLWRLITQPYRIKRIFNATFGLITCLWHYKVFTSLPIRKNAAIVILNRQNRVLVCQRNPKDFHIDVITTQEALQRKNYWQLPQGGVDGTENIVEAAKREAKEETGIQSLELIKISEKTNTYIWNNALRKFWHNRRHRNIGQIQNVVYFKFTGTDDEIKIDNHEFINYQWTDINSLPEIIHPERAGLVKIAADDLNEMLKNAII